MSYDPERGYWAGHRDATDYEQRKTAAQRKASIYFIGVALDYLRTVDGVSKRLVERMKAHLKELKQNA